MKCESFQALLVYINACEALNAIHISAIFNRWSELWQNAHEPKLKNENLEERLQEIAVMEWHLWDSKGSYTQLIARASVLINKFCEVSFTSIAYAISYLPITEGSKTLLKLISSHILESEYSLKNYAPLPLATLINAISKVLPEEESTRSLMAKIEKQVVAPEYSFSDDTVAILAYTFAKLNVHNKALFEKLSISIKVLDLSQLEKLRVSQICMFYHYAQCENIIRIDATDIEKLEVLLKQREPAPAALTLNVEKIFKNLTQWLSLNHMPLQLMREYFIAGTYVDLAILTTHNIPIKVAIEIDGPCHYRTNEKGERLLKRKSVLKTKILEKGCGWHVIRLPHFELEKTEELTKYLLDKIPFLKFLVVYLLQNWLDANKISLKLVREYFVKGAYVDIAVLSDKDEPIKVAIEIEKDVKLGDLKTALLEKIAGWKVIRLSYSELALRQTNTEVLQKYLLDKILPTLKCLEKEKPLEKPKPALILSPSPKLPPLKVKRPKKQRQVIWVPPKPPPSRRPLPLPPYPPLLRGGGWRRAPGGGALSANQENAGRTDIIVAHHPNSKHRPPGIP